jgi:hypothetical protein
VNPHQCEHLKSCTKEYKEQVKRGWKCHVGKAELQEVQYVEDSFNITYKTNNEKNNEKMKSSDISL